MIRRLAAFALVSLAALVALAVPASAHVEVAPTEAVSGSTASLTFTVEYEGAATTGLVVQLPEGATATNVPDKAGWTSSVDEAERTVTWTGGSSAVDEEFGVEVRLPTTTGEVLFPAIQQTTDGEIAWIEEQESEGETGNPAARLTLTAAPGATTTTKANGSSTTSTTDAAEVTTTTSDLPGTTLEADERDDGTTSAAPWIIGSAIAAIVAIAVGGTLLKRKQDRENAADEEARQAQSATEPPTAEGGAPEAPEE